jgi:hypothetical protein
VVGLLRCPRTRSRGCRRPGRTGLGYLLRGQRQIVGLVGIGRTFRKVLGKRVEVHLFQCREAVVHYEAWTLGGAALGLVQPSSQRDAVGGFEFDVLASHGCYAWVVLGLISTDVFQGNGY